MFIAAFAEATGLTRDTIRFYVRKGLLRPTVGSGAGNRYRIFDAADVERALMIRSGQALGFTLREIVALEREATTEGMTFVRQAELMRERIVAIDEQIDSLASVRAYLVEKVAWLDTGAIGPQPTLRRTK